MFDFEIAFYLYKIAKILKIFEENKYKSNAYFSAAMAIDSYDKYITQLHNEKKLKSIESIGESSAKIVDEILTTGKCEQLISLENLYGIKDYSLILSHGLNEKTVKKLFDNGIISYNDLIKAKSLQIIPSEFSKS